MEADEACVLLASALLTAKVGIPWYARLASRTLTKVRGLRAMRLILGGLPVALLAALAVTLRLGAAREVREHGEYVLLFVALGAAWLIGLSWASGWLGVHVQDDALERNNAAAAIAVSGTLAGGMIVYAGANLGEGDTIWKTIGPAFLASSLLLALWGMHQVFSGATDAITLDRDLASSIRFAGMALGTSLVIGRAAAGDYTSALDTVRDLFVQGWPALPLAVLGVFVQIRLRPSKQRAKPNAVTYGLVPALAYLVLGLILLLCLGSFCPTGARQ